MKPPAGEIGYLFRTSGLERRLPLAVCAGPESLTETGLRSQSRSEGAVGKARGAGAPQSPGCASAAPSPLVIMKSLESGLSFGCFLVFGTTHFPRGRNSSPPFPLPVICPVCVGGASLGVWEQSLRVLGCWSQTAPKSGCLSLGKRQGGARKSRPPARSPPGEAGEGGWESASLARSPSPPPHPSPPGWAHGLSLQQHPSRHTSPPPPRGRPQACLGGAPLSTPLTNKLSF